MTKNHNYVRTTIETFIRNSMSKETYAQYVESSEEILKSVEKKIEVAEKEWAHEEYLKTRGLKSK